MSLNNVGIPSGALVSPATSSSDGTASPADRANDPQSGGAFFRSLASSPAAGDSSRSRATQSSTQAPATQAPASGSASTKTTGNSSPTGSSSNRKAAGAGSAKKVASGAPAADPASSDTQATDSAAAESSSQVTDPSDASQPGTADAASPAGASATTAPEGVVELLAASSNASKKPVSQTQLSAAQSSSSDSETGTPSALANVLSKGSQSPPTGTNPQGKSGPSQDASSAGANAAASLPAAAASANTQTATAVSSSANGGNLATASLTSVPPSTSDNSTDPTGGQPGNTNGSLTAAAAQSAAAGPYQSPAATAASSSQSDEEMESSDANLVVGAAAQTTEPLPTIQQTNATGAGPTTTSKVTGTSDQPAVEKPAAAQDQSSLGVTSTAGSNPRTEPQTTSNHATANTTADPVQRSQELVDRVANTLRTAFDTAGQMRVRLEPPALGRVQVEVSTGSSGLTARLEVQTASARQTLLDNISMLHTAIAQTGASVSRIDVVVAPQPKDDSASERQPSSDGQQQASTQGDSQGGAENRQNGQKQNRTGGRSSSIDQLDIEV